jgi:class 3 adenylate cyclase/tetratricopeptide (TPR) repeat protein
MDALGPPMDCQDCHHANPANARFCASCGAALVNQCTGCKTPFVEGQRFCSHCGLALNVPAPDNSAVDEGERRQVTVVFSDLSGYTALNEKLDPEEVEVIMGRIKRRASEIVETQSGTVNQFVGDEIMVLFGVPVARRDDPHRAVRAALELHSAVNEIAAEIAPRIGRTLTMHTGINSGLIVARRSDSRSGRYTVTGDTINTGARLLGIARADEIVVGQDTWRQISGQFVGEAGPAVEVKGKEHPLIPFRVRGERTADEAARRPLVGRAEEMRQFSALAQSCHERRRGRLIVVRGDPGIGKSRLAHEFLTVAKRQGFDCHSALVLDFRAERGRDTIRSLARDLLAIEPGADEGSRRFAVVRAIAEGQSAAGQELFLYDLLDVAPPAELRSVQSAISEQARHQGTLETLRELVRRASAKRPLMVLIEDIHWADALTLERLGAIAALASECTLLVALTTRFDGDPSVGAWRSTLNRTPTTGIDLGPLAAEDALALTEQFGGLDKGLAERYVERAEGNPLFLEQLLLTSEEAGQASVPGSIQALVLARMDRLAPDDRLALQAAAVLGQRFSIEVVAALIETPDYRPNRLIEHFLIRPEGLDFLFCHALIRDGAYESLLKSRRRALHARAAQWFEERDPVLAAQHYDRAEHDKAPRAYLVACEAESARYHYRTALLLARRGLELATGRDERVALGSMLASVLNETGQARESMDAWRAALGFCETGAERCQVLIGLAQGMRIVDEIASGLANLAQAEVLASEAALPLELARIHHLRGNYFFGLGQSGDCLREHEKAFRYAREADSTEAMANALGGLGDAHYVSGRMRSANEQFRRCVDLAREHGLGRIEVANMHMVGWSLHYLGALRPALVHGLDSAQMAATVSHRRVEILASHLAVYVGGCLIGETPEALRRLDAALVICRSLGAKRFEGQNLMYRAQLVLREGDRREAERISRTALEFVREHGMDFCGAITLGLLARLTEDPTERMRLNAEAREQLARGAISHNHVEYYVQAIESALENRAWDDVADCCAALERYTISEPLPWTEFLVARGRAITRAERGELGAAIVAELARLREIAVQYEYNVLIPGLDTAMAHAPGGSKPG